MGMSWERKQLESKAMAERLFPDASTKGSLQLQGKLLEDGDSIEISVFGHWLPGRLAYDSAGWYLVTPDNVGVRLRPGILARLPERPLWMASNTAMHAPLPDRRPSGHL